MIMIAFEQYYIPSTPLSSITLYAHLSHVINMQQYGTIHWNDLKIFHWLRGSEIGKYMKQKKPKINSVGWKHTRVENKKKKAQASTASHHLVGGKIGN